MGFTHPWGTPKQDPEKINDSDAVFNIVGEWLLTGPFEVGEVATVTG